MSKELLKKVAVLEKINHEQKAFIELLKDVIGDKERLIELMEHWQPFKEITQSQPAKIVSIKQSCNAGKK